MPPNAYKHTLTRAHVSHESRSHSESELQHSCCFHALTDRQRIRCWFSIPWKRRGKNHFEYANVVIWSAWIHVLVVALPAGTMWSNKTILNMSEKEIIINDGDDWWRSTHANVFVWRTYTVFDCFRFSNGRVCMYCKAVEPWRVRAKITGEWLINNNKNRKSKRTARVKAIAGKPQMCYQNYLFIFSSHQIVYILQSPRSIALPFWHTMQCPLRLWWNSYEVIFMSLPFSRFRFACNCKMKTKSSSLKKSNGSLLTSSRQKVNKAILFSDLSGRKTFNRFHLNIRIKVRLVHFCDTFSVSS